LQQHIDLRCGRVKIAAEVFALGGLEAQRESQVVIGFPMPFGEQV
jgi:hypothetical protein